MFALCLLPASFKSLLPTFLQKSTAAFGEGASLNTLFLFPVPSKSLLLPFLQKRESFASFSSEKEVPVILQKSKDPGP